VTGTPLLRDGRVLLVFAGALGDFLLLAPSIAALRAMGIAVELSVPRALQDLAHDLFPGAAGPPADGASMRSLFTSEVDTTLAAWLQGAARLDAWLGELDVLERHARVLGIGAVRRLHVERGEVGPHASEASASRFAIRPILPPIPATWLDESSTRPRGLVIHPGAGAVAKRWTAAGFRAVADAWRARGGETIVLLGPAEEGERAQWRTSGHEVACGLDLREVVTLLASVPRYLGNDSGISHLAGVLGRRGVVLFGPTHAARWRPLGSGLEPLVHNGLTEEDTRAQVLARLAAAGYLDTPIHRH
jgi:heptosyltransferase III